MAGRRAATGERLVNALISVEQHRARILEALDPLAIETVPVDAAGGLVCAVDARAALDIPVFDNSAMDGFAVRADDLAHATAEAPVALRVVADLPAGSSDDPELRSGEAARIMTGSGRTHHGRARRLAPPHRGDDRHDARAAHPTSRHRSRRRRRRRARG